MCDKNITISENSNFSCWENKATTRDEREIIDYLKNNLHIIKNKKILHIGIGNSELGLTFYKYAKYIDGVTISVPEKIKALNYNCYRNIHICNKYNLNDMKQLLKDNYDLIIDQGIKCYTCCQTHFEELFKFYIEKLNKKGIFVTSKLGMNWSGYNIYLKFKNNLINDDTNPDKSNCFTQAELKKLVNKYWLNINKLNNIILIKHINIIISLTTVPRRFNEAINSINYLIKNNCKYKIILNIPKTYRKWKNFNIPNIKLHNNIIINKCSLDYGPATKLIGTLEYLKINKLFNIKSVITIDDDQFYNVNYLEKLALMGEKYKNTIITKHGMSLLNYPFKWTNGISHDKTPLYKSDFPIGVDGVLYPIEKLINSDIYNLIYKLPNYVFCDDDTYFGMIAYILNIPIITVSEEIKKISSRIRNKNCGGSACHEGINKDRDTCSSELVQFGIKHNYLRNI